MLKMLFKINTKRTLTLFQKHFFTLKLIIRIIVKQTLFHAFKKYKFVIMFEIKK